MATKRKIANTTSSPGRVIKDKPSYDEASGSRDVRPFRLEGDIQTKEDIMKVLVNKAIIAEKCQILAKPGNMSKALAWLTALTDSNARSAKLGNYLFMLSK